MNAPASKSTAVFHVEKITYFLLTIFMPIAERWYDSLSKVINWMVNITHACIGKHVILSQ